jgi:hypothetical protein
MGGKVALQRPSASDIVGEEVLCVGRYPLLPFARHHCRPRWDEREESNMDVSQRSRSNPETFLAIVVFGSWTVFREYSSQSIRSNRLFPYCTVLYFHFVWLFPQSLQVFWPCVVIHPSSGEGR